MISENCASARFVMKTDDDIYLNIQNLNEFLAGEYFEQIHGVYGRDAK